MSVAHLDLKPDNVLMVSGTAKISDLGCAKLCHPEDRMPHNSKVGTEGFMDPAPATSSEPKAHFDKSSDIYSLGAIAWCLFHSKTAPRCVKCRNFLRPLALSVPYCPSTCQGGASLNPRNKWPENVQKMIQTCLNPAQTLRCNIDEVVKLLIGFYLCYSILIYT